MSNTLHPLFWAYVTKSGTLVILPLVRSLDAGGGQEYRQAVDDPSLDVFCPFRASNETHAREMIRQTTGYC